MIIIVISLTRANPSIHAANSKPEKINTIPGNIGTSKPTNPTTTNNPAIIQYQSMLILYGAFTKGKRALIIAIRRFKYVVLRCVS